MNRIKELRENAGLTQQALADKVGETHMGLPETS